MLAIIKYRINPKIKVIDRPLVIINASRLMMNKDIFIFFMNIVAYKHVKNIAIDMLVVITFCVVGPKSIGAVAPIIVAAAAFSLSVNLFVIKYKGIKYNAESIFCIMKKTTN